MITSVKEIHTSIEGHGEDECTFYNYFICRCVAANVPRFHLFRLSGVQDEYELLGNELPLDMCRKIIAKHEPNGTKVKKHYAGGKRR
jgi:hypothetical protein